jgi:intracellular septation protein
MSNGPSSPIRTNIKPWLEYGPLVVFLVVNFKWGLLPATAALVPLSLVALFGLWKLEGRVSRMALFGTLAVLVFGGLALVFRDENVVKIKLTVIYGLLGLVLWIGLLRGKSLIREVLGAHLPLSDEGWRKLTVRFVWLCFFVALLNEVVRRRLSSDAWVNFKVFGVTGLTFVFMVAQAPLLAKHSPKEPDSGA